MPDLPADARLLATRTTSMSEALPDDAPATGSSSGSSSYEPGVARVAGGIGHKLRNVMSAILTYAQLIADDEQASTTLKEDAGYLLEAARAAEQLSADLQRCAGRRSLHESHGADLHEALASLREELARRAGAPLSWALCGDMLITACGTDHLRGILGPLLDNAAEAGGAVTIETRAEAGHALLVVRDDGEGMAPEVLARALDPFFSDRSDHAGLGLPMAAGLVVGVGGTFTITSAPGAGAECVMRLPLFPAAEPG